MMMSVKEKLASYFCCCCSAESTKSANDEFKSSLAIASAVKETEETVDAHYSEAHRPSDQWLQDLLANHRGNKCFQTGLSNFEEDNHSCLD